MTCMTCEAKLKTVFSVPIGKQYRYRIYWCEPCLKGTDTMEIPTHWRHKERLFRIMFAIGRKKAVNIRRWLNRRSENGGY